MAQDIELQPLEQSLVSFLKNLTGKHVGTRVPVNRPDSFTIVRRTGGGRRNLVQSDPTLLLEVWGSGNTQEVKVHPWNLTKQVWEALAQADELDLPLGVEVMRVNITEPVDYPDEATGCPRYTFIFNPTVNL